MLPAQNFTSYLPPPGSGSNPPKRKQQGSFSSSTTFRPAQEVQKAMEEEPHHEWGGLMPIKQFFEECLPVPNLKGLPKAQEEYFDTTPKGKGVKESEMYDPLVGVLSTSLLGFKH